MFNCEKILLAFYFIHYNLCHGSDCYYSLSSMYEQFDLEIERLNMLETYIDNEYKRLDNIRSFIEQRTIQNEKELAASYTESSINAFKTILRVKTDWETLKNEMAQTTKIENFEPPSMTQNDIESVFKAIRRLQIVFELDSNDLASGNIDDFEFEKLDVNDCFKMADTCFDNVELHCAYEWFKEVEAKYNNTDEIQFNYQVFMQNYVWSAYLVGDLNNAKRIMDIYEDSGYGQPETILNMKYIVWSGDEVFKRNTANDPDKKFYSFSLQKLNLNEEVGNFITACQDMNTNSNYLKCRYNHGGSKFLKIAPLREETISIVPEMKLYHNVLFDNEIEKIKELAKPKLKKLVTDTNEDISLRKVAVFNKQNDTVFNVINNRLAQMSLKPKSRVSNKYVVTNYGLAGHYLPHPQYIDNDHLINSKGRQAIIIFHMDDVPGGGCTVLPDAEVGVPSIKGSALVVYNTRSLVTPYGIAYADTQYGSCPIFYGDKWTLTAWFEDKKL